MAKTQKKKPENAMVMTEKKLRSVPACQKISANKERAVKVRKSRNVSKKCTQKENPIAYEEPPAEVSQINEQPNEDVPPRRLRIQKIQLLENNTKKAQDREKEVESQTGDKILVAGGPQKPTPVMKSTGIVRKSRNGSKKCTQKEDPIAYEEPSAEVSQINEQPNKDVPPRRLRIQKIQLLEDNTQNAQDRDKGAKSQAEDKILVERGPQEPSLMKSTEIGKGLEHQTKDEEKKKRNSIKKNEKKRQRKRQSELGKRVRNLEQELQHLRNVQPDSVTIPSYISAQYSGVRMMQQRPYMPLGMMRLSPPSYTGPSVGMPIAVPQLSVQSHLLPRLLPSNYCGFLQPPPGYWTVLQDSREPWTGVEQSQMQSTAATMTPVVPLHPYFY